MSKLLLVVKKLETYPCGATSERKFYYIRYLGVGYSPVPKPKTRDGCPVHGWKCTA